MELFLTLLIPFVIMLLLWDSQPTPIRILEVEERNETYVCTVGILKWPFTLKHKVYLVKSNNTWVIPTRKSALHPVLAYSDVQEAYIIWKYDNNVT